MSENTDPMGTGLYFTVGLLVIFVICIFNFIFFFSTTDMTSNNMHVLFVLSYWLP